MMPSVIIGIIINGISPVMIVGISPVWTRIPDKAPVRLIPDDFPPWIIIEPIIPVR